MKIQFHKATLKDKDIVLSWYQNLHVLENWDTSQTHKDDLICFMKGRPEPSPYANGIFDYWVGTLDNEPFALIMTAEVSEASDLMPLWRENLSKTGKTWGLDYMIGSKKHFGKGLGALTLAKFTQFFQENIEPTVDTFYIDPEQGNLRAKHVYEKAGFKVVAEFKRDCSNKEGLLQKDLPHFLMVKKIFKPPQSARLSFRAIREDDFENLYRLDSDPEVRKFFPTGVLDAKGLKNKIEKIRDQQAFHGFSILIVEDLKTHAFLGRSGLWIMDDGEVEAGYLFLKDYWGKGYATEALKAMLHWGHTVIQLPRIIAFAPEDHHASLRVMEKCLMKPFKRDTYLNTKCVFYESLSHQT